MRFCKSQTTKRYCLGFGMVQLLLGNFRNISYHRFTHSGQVTHISVIRLNNHWFRKWFVTYTARSHYLNQWWYIVHLVLRSTCQCNIIWNLKVFIQENVFENVVYEMAAIFSRPQCVKCTCRCQIAGNQCHHCGVTSHEVHGVSCHPPPPPPARTHKHTTHTQNAQQCWSRPHGMTSRSV